MKELLQSRAQSAAGTAADPAADPVAVLVAGFAARRPVRAGSVIVTVYGDAIAPRGGEAAVGSLLPLLDSLGINGSQVRTALSRLSADGWFDRFPVGRRSYYGLSPLGRRRFEEATRRIYGGPPLGWDGAWRLVVIPGGPTARREILRKELNWLGFGELSPNALIHPSPDLAALASIVEDLPPPERPVVIAGESMAGSDPEVLRRLVEDCWDLAGLAAEYEAFCARFTALAEDLATGRSLAPLPAMQARILLIHDFRRLVLRDPMLPSELLPDGWIGWRAYGLTAGVYRALLGPSERWLETEVKSRDGALPAPGQGFRRRFAGSSGR
ncbi:phenylacetic acid degradation operon negative regulatory protein PaaX [Algihabitans albus]|uniref:phenylacetic acid degradation operon negative regulatory protein PaaX n=1 Tax=Algihabitans albus TaxID=2164067 RepID=UPI000E5C94AC|nr:phenylacetic acid degradation operon negative regulatory protein PaaX [Algihabitans albus]